MSSFEIKNDEQKIYIGIFVAVLILLLGYWYMNKTSETFASQPAVVLFTRSTEKSSNCSGDGRSDACASYIFSRLRRWYGSIQLYQISDIDQNADIPVGMIQQTPTIAYLPEGPGNFNLVRIYTGPITTDALEKWVKSLPAAQ